MDYYQLHCFKVTAEYENITKASEYLHISQPSLSQTIHRLEAEIGYPLFDREHKRIILNQSGRILYEKVSLIEDVMHEAKIELEELNGMGHPTVSLTVKCASMLLPDLLRFLVQEYPDIEFRVQQWSSQAHADDQDIQILAEPKVAEDIVLLDERFLLAIPKTHPLASKEAVFLADLEGAHFIQLTEQWSLQNQVKQGLKKYHFIPHITMYFDNPCIMREVLQNQIGIAFVPEITWHSFGTDQVIMKPVEDCVFRRKVYLHAPNTYLTKEQKQCIRGILSFFSNL